eukprot:TRINITY_DN22506_c0_g1_i1.p1 TRINITY_DN22506_c0_g1~~TRINITY_DN22506_c0_g1_i1.p1  ORF type:complete len:199 (+),score=62.17 TRINITY_DN22506_c0_g1_i1:129-725(+)
MLGLGQGEAAASSPAGADGSPAGPEGDQGAVFVPLDPDIGVYESTFDLESRLCDREFAKREHHEHVFLVDVEAEMQELKADKNAEDGADDITKALEALTRATVMPRSRDGEAKPQLTAVRLCEIENRLKTDASLVADDDGEGGVKLSVEDEKDARAQVKRTLVRMYNKIRSSGMYGDLTDPVLHALDEKLAILKNPRF